MNLIDKTLLVLAPQAALKRKTARIAYNRLSVLDSKAGYDGGGTGRRWFWSNNTSQNAENRRYLKNLRQSSRELERNNPYVSIATNVIDSYTVGTGIVPKAKHFADTREARKKIVLADSLMKDWVENVELDYNGQLNLFGLQGLSLRSIITGGESIFVKRTATDRRLAVPLRLQLLEGEHIDDSKDSGVSNGNGNVQGVAFSANRFAGLHLFEQHPGDSFRFNINSNLVPADQVAHGFEILRPGQLRGIPVGYSVFTRIKGLDDVNDALIELQRMAACFGFAVYNEDGETKRQGVLPETVEPGMAIHLTGNDRILFSDPPTASGQEAHIRSNEQLIASAYGISYSALTGDFSNGNFAAEKMARIQMYMTVARRRRRMLVPMQLKKIEKWWLEAAALAGYDLRGISFQWTPPRKEILDLKNEIPAIVQKLRAGLGSLQSELREWGMDPDMVLNEIAEDGDLMQKLGIVLDSDPRATNRSGQLQSLPASPASNDENTEAEDDAS